MIQENKNTVESIAAILDSPVIKALWGRYYFTSKGADAPSLMAAKIRYAENNLKRNPELLTFMRALVDIERGAMGNARGRENAPDSQLRGQLDGLSRYICRLSAGVVLPGVSELPEDQQNILSMLKNETAQNPFRPLETIMGAAKYTGNEIITEAKEHPASFVWFLSASLGLMWFMNRKIGPSGNSYIDPEVTTITNLSLDALEDPNFRIETNLSLLDLNFQPGCHDHLVQIFGRGMADIVKNTLEAGGLFPQHCTKLKTMALDAQGTLQGGYGWVNERLGWFTEDVAAAIGNNMPDSNFSRSFIEAAHNAAENVYAFDAIENIVIHSILFQTSFYAARKAVSLENQETVKLCRKAGDIVRRSLSGAPLSFIFGLAASSVGFLENNGFGPEMIWMGAGGALAGHFAHKAARYLKRERHVLNITESARESLAGFSAPSRNVTGCRAEHSLLPAQISEKIKKNRGGLTAKAVLLFSAASLPAAAIAAELSGKLDKITDGVLKVVIVRINDISAHALGNGLVWGNYFLVNIPQDMGLHIIFGIAGGSLGLAYGIAENAAKRIYASLTKPELVK